MDGQPGPGRLNVRKVQPRMDVVSKHGIEAKNDNRKAGGRKVLENVCIHVSEER